MNGISLLVAGTMGAIVTTLFRRMRDKALYMKEDKFYQRELLVLEKIKDASWKEYYNNPNSKKLMKMAHEDNERYINLLKKKNE